MPNDLMKATRFGDSSIEACASRLSLALEAVGLSQTELANSVGLQNSSITNMVKARQFPSRDVMIYLYYEYGVDFNYMFVGEVASLRQTLIDKIELASSRKVKILRQEVPMTSAAMAK